MAKPTIINLPVFGIVVTLDETNPTIASDLHCDPDPSGEGGSEEDTAYDRLDASLAAIELLILAHALAGVDIQAPAYVEGINNSVIGLGVAAGLRGRGDTK